MNAVRNKVVIITGASSGFGRGAALKFAEQGAKLVLAARRSKLIKQLAKECQGKGGRAIAVQADVSSRQDVAELARTAIEQFGHFDIWINNAGVAAYGEFIRVPLEEHEQVLRTNLFGTFYGSYAAMNHFRQRGTGLLINMASFLGRGSAPYHGSYVASKHGIRGLDTALRQELEANGISGIRVCTVMPTSHDTPFFSHAANYSGKPVRPISPVYDPQQVADALVEVVANPQDEVVVGTSAKVASVAQKIAPGVVERQMAKKVHKEHFGQQQSSADTSGNLFEPMGSGTTLQGGWLDEKNGRSKAAKTAAIAAVPIALGVFALVKRQKSREQSQAA